MGDKIVKNAEGYREGDVETWYDSIKEETFKTEFIPLEPDDARAIIAAFYQEANKDQTARLKLLVVRHLFC